MEPIFQAIKESITLNGLAIVLTIVVPVITFFVWFKKKITPKKEIDPKLSQQNFKIINERFIGTNRNNLSKIAYSINLKYLRDSYFDKSLFIEDHKLQLPLLTKADWIPENPLPLNEVTSSFSKEITPKIDPYKTSLPYQNKINRYQTLNNAIKDILKPRLFKDNPQYRILDICSDKTSFRFKISEQQYSYFSKLNYGKGAEYELALELIRINKLDPHNSVIRFEREPKISKSKLLFRKKILDGIKETGKFHKSVILGGISTLTLIYKDDDFRFILHNRCKKQGYAADIKHVIPAGEYQPLSRGNNFSYDLPFWHNIMREYAEELGNMKEFTGDEGRVFNYSKTYPFNKFSDAIESGSVKPFFLGVGLDPLSLQAEILSVCIFKEESFVEIFGKEVLLKNEEGTIITAQDQWGIPFTEKEVSDRIDGDMLAAGEAILKISCKHKKWLLNQIN